MDKRHNKTLSDIEEQYDYISTELQVITEETYSSIAKYTESFNDTMHNIEDQLKVVKKNVVKQDEKIKSISRDVEYILAPSKPRDVALKNNMALLLFRAL